MFPMDFSLRPWNFDSDELVISHGCFNFHFDECGDLVDVQSDFSRHKFTVSNTCFSPNCNRSAPPADYFFKKISSPA
jgi:hypothetical protein